MTRRDLLTAMPLTMASAAIHAQRYIDGVLVHDGRDPIELLAYATSLPSGGMDLAQASFHDDRAARRELRFQVRQLNIYALDLRIPDVDQPAGVTRLASQARAGPDNPLFLFVTMTSDRMLREYMVQLSIAA